MSTVSYCHGVNKDCLFFSLPDLVFHPKCVDEWLQKWNRTCPLCKITIKRKKRSTNNPPTQTNTEASLLLPQREDQADRNNSNYGATGLNSVFRDASSPSSNLGHSGSRATSVDIELSVGSNHESPASQYHTPQLSEDEEEPIPTFDSAHNSHSSTSEFVSL